MKNVILLYWCMSKLQNLAGQQTGNRSKEEKYTEIYSCEGDAEFMDRPENGVRGAASLQRDGIAHLVADVDVHFISHAQG